MLVNKDKGILLQIVNRCERIENKVKTLEESKFFDDIDLIEIVSFNLFQIGELAKKLSDEFIKEYNKIPWKYVKGMRDKIGHGYDTIDISIVWETASKDIKNLKIYCKNILEKS